MPSVHGLTELCAPAAISNTRASLSQTMSLQSSRRQTMIANEGAGGGGDDGGGAAAGVNAGEDGATATDDAVGVANVGVLGKSESPVPGVLL